MHIAMIGTGYVGLVSGTCFSEFGFKVTCVDRDQDKIRNLQQGIVPIYEPGLQTLISKNTKSGRLKFSTDLSAAVRESSVVFIAVGTPTRETDGAADLSYVLQAAKEIALSLQGYTVIVVKSTVPVDTAQKLTHLIRETNPKAEFDVVSNPEFLREGSAIEDFMQPDRVVVGVTTMKARKVMEQLYQPLSAWNVPIVYTTPETSELIKYAANSFLATKIAFINEISDLCEKTNANIQDIAKGIGLDSRIGSKFLNVGPGYGGSCFPKDTIALVQTAQTYGSPLNIIEAVVKSNEDRKKKIAYKIIDRLHGSVKGKKIAILGLTFKPETDDMRESPSLEIIPILQNHGAEIYAYDPEGMENARKLLPTISWGKDAYEPMKNADATVILTEWNEFKSLDLDKVSILMKNPLLIDCRNLYNPLEMADKGIMYVSLGRKTYPVQSSISVSEVSS
jgi:UDPglucose 6-dehydrogenase